MLGFMIFLKIMGQVSTAALAASNIVIVITSMSWMPAIGLGIGAAILLGQHLGAGEPDRAERVGWESMKIAVVCMGALGVVFMTVPELCVRVFTDDAAVIADGAVGLRLMGIMQFVDSFAIIAFSCLQGAGNTWYVMKLDLALMWGLFLPLSYVLALPAGAGMAGGWGALIVYGAVYATIATAKFRAGAWKRIVL